MKKFFCIFLLVLTSSFSFGFDRKNETLIHYTKPQYVAHVNVIGLEFLRNVSLFYQWTIVCTLLDNNCLSCYSGNMHWIECGGTTTQLCDITVPMMGTIRVPCEVIAF